MITIICGHYGVGKTNLSLNIASQLKKDGKEVTLIDMDVVNPYFISSNYKNNAALKGIKVISPRFAGTNVDMPSIPVEVSGEINSAFEKPEKHVIIDAGGDDVGVTALGSFSQTIKDSGNYTMLYVINCYRALTTTAQEAAELLWQIEAASRLKATGIVNNSHLSNLTTKEDILESLPFADEISKLTSLEVKLTTIPKNIVGELLPLNKNENANENIIENQIIKNLMPVEIYVKTIWA